MVVSLLTILLVSFASHDVRQWLLYGREALSKLKGAQARLASLEKEGAVLESQNRGLRTNIQELDSQAIRLRTQISLQKQAIAKQTASVARLQAQVVTFERRTRELNSRLETNRTELSVSKKSLEKARGALVAIRTEIRKAESERGRAIAESNDIQRENLRVYAQNAQLGKDVANLEQRIRDLQIESNSLQNRRTEIEADLTQSRQDLERTRVELFGLESELKSIQADYNLAVNYSKILGSTFATARKAPMTFKFGEEVVRMAVTSKLSEDDAKASLDVLLSMARTSASARGAKPNGPYSSADLVDHQDVVMNRTIPASEIRANIVRQITDQTEDLVLVAYSSLNAFEGEPVSLEIGVFKNPIVYRAGTNLAETRIDGSKDEPTIFRQVVQFLADRVSARVAKDQLIPRSGSEQPFGEVTTEEILNLVTQIRKADRRVLIRAQVDDDTRASDRVKLRFQLF
jgi:predicted  nucleic acid-binding Zn-ribbon protein